jgi:hypothetical protein
MNFASTRMEIVMNKDERQSLLLLDLCAFAASIPQCSSRLEVLRDFEVAYILAESHSLPDRHSYRDFMDRI